jgi:hypothetical protein
MLCWLESYGICGNIGENSRGVSQKGDFKQFTLSIMYCRGGEVANSGLLRQPLLFLDCFYRPVFFDSLSEQVLLRTDELIYIYYCKNTISPFSIREIIPAKEV